LKEAPVFLEKIFGKEYFMELASTKITLSEHPDFYEAAATKACRISIMIGDVLQYSQMANILQQLSELNSPWNCPHGRPTLIFLSSFNQLNRQNLCPTK
jgi:DNA mismatch repair protein PMS2